MNTGPRITFHRCHRPRPMMSVDHHFGECGYDESEKWILSLLERGESRATPRSRCQCRLPPGSRQHRIRTTCSRPRRTSDASGYRTSHRAADSITTIRRTIEDRANSSRFNGRLMVEGDWRDEGQIATLLSPTGSIDYRLHARDLHLMLGPAKGGKPVRFRVTIDGKAPGVDHGVDTDADGYGAGREDRLYQLIRQHSTI